MFTGPVKIGWHVLGSVSVTMKNQKTWIAIAAGAGMATLAGLTYALWPKKKIPKSAIVDNFEIDRYMGTWNEIARLPNLIEKNLHNLTEEYTLNEDGTVGVVTRAYNIEKNKPVEASGTAKLKGAGNRGEMGVAYYLPFYLDYNLLAIDPNYRYAMVSGSGMDYLWLLSRENTIPEEFKKQFITKATSLGFDIPKLQWMD